MMHQDEYTPGSISDLFGGKDKDDSSNPKLFKLFLKPAKIPEQVVPGHKEKVKLLSVKPKRSELTDEKTRKGSEATAKSGEVNNSLNKQKTDPQIKLSHNEDLSLQRSKEKIEEKNGRSVFVGCLPVNVKKKAPEDPKLPRKAVAATGKFHPKVNTLNAYIVFKNQLAAEKATELNNTYIDGNHIRVDFLGSKNKQHDHKRSIFVGNLPFDVHEEEVRKHFSECGQIETVRLIRDKLTRFGKGFGYVLFSDKDSVLLSLKLDGLKFKGRYLRVQRSTPNAQTSYTSVKRPNQTQVKKVDKAAEYKKRKYSETDQVDDRMRKKKIAVKFNAQTGKLTLRKRDKVKKKLKRKIEKKKKEKVADFLLGNKKDSQKQK
ncbi:hypothetical protein LSH36_96g05026 [Paralvinella palmiformis]|uniref:RRM domain-containing protein n=1 Tax=Paralvinella palmiformis TaxID=53620 RepID=A0AAD9K262_9ANNE|nr:hypothetical protein LSH36_96g05026 [Paralvinella palmiformis]